MQFPCTFTPLVAVPRLLPVLSRFSTICLFPKSLLKRFIQSFRQIILAVRRVMEFLKYHLYRDKIHFP